MKYFFFLPEIRSGGSENIIINIANFLEKEKNTVYILSINKNKYIFNKINKNIKFIELPKNKFKKFTKIYNLLKINKPDKIISILGISFYLLIINLIFKKKYSLYIRLATNIGAQYKNLYYWQFFKKIKLIIFASLLNQANKIFVQSKSMKNDLIIFNKNIISLNTSYTLKFF